MSTGRQQERTVSNEGVRCRAFLVGCPRSGTTLLQCLLATHSDVASFPETRFFTRHVGQYSSRLLDRRPRSILEATRSGGAALRLKLGLSNPSANAYVYRWLSDLGRKDLVPFVSQSPFLRTKLKSCVRILDELAIEQGKSVWIEKTPEHVGYLDIIRSVVPGAKVIHILRDGRSVVASICEAARRYPEHWSACFKDVDVCVSLWNRCLELSIGQETCPNRRIVTYESLVQEPATVMKELCSFLGVEYEETMVESYAAQVSTLTTPIEGWKANVGRPIQSANGSKYETLLTDRERDYVTAHLKPTPIFELPASAAC